MRDLITVSTPHGPIPDLPVTARTRSGVQFDPSSERWVYRDSASTVSLNFPHLKMVREEVVTSIKAVMLWYAENMSPSHLKNMFSHMERFLRTKSGKRASRIHVSPYIRFPGGFT
jgi:hypothetical protein